MLGLTEQQKALRAETRSFLEAEIAPLMPAMDEEGFTPPAVVKRLAERGLFGAMIPKEFGGQALDAITVGLLNEELGRISFAMRDLIFVPSMVTYALARWGAREQQERWLPRMATGEVIPAFSLTEPNVGSDAKRVETRATLSGDAYVLNGRKKWTTYGQLADVFLVFATCEEKPTAFLVERNTPGLTVHPMKGILGVRPSMHAELELEDCRIPAANLVGTVGWGFQAVASAGLELGRYCIAWGCVGLAQACLEASLKYVRERKQFGVPIGEHQLVQQMIAEMVANIKAARLLCYEAGQYRDAGDPRAAMHANLAKYYASRMATRVANDAVQIHGANGVSADYRVAMHFRDARVTEIIEGTTQIQQVLIAKRAIQQGDLVD